MRPHPTRLAVAARAACAAALLLPPWAVFAQDATQRIEITGSSIKRIDAETALPVQVISRDEIERSGVVNVEQLLQTVSATTSSGAFASSASSGSTTGSISSISLRGLTSLRTLVLVNGRRVAPYGVGFTGDSVSVDVGNLPLAAIERVEVLKDGASAVYGSDAVAGVVNFILRRDFQGAELAIDYGDSTAGGASARRASITAGAGRLASDGYHLMLVASFQKEGALFGRDRDFASRGYNVEANNDTSSANTFPGNIVLLDSAGNFGNPRAPECPGPYSADTPFSAGGGFCLFDPSPLITLLPATERASLFASGKLRLSATAEAFAEASMARSRQRVVIQPVPLSYIFTLPDNNPLIGQSPYNGTLADGSASGLPPGRSTIVVYPGSTYYPTDTVRTLLADPADPLPPITVLYRSAATGNRDFTDISEAPRLVLGLRGAFAGWDYETALLHSESRVREQVNDGFPANSLILPLLNSGEVNFWGPSAPEVEALLRATNFTGDAFRVKSGLSSVSARGSHDLMDLAGGPMTIALGAEVRRESYLFDPNPTIQTGDISGYGGNFLVTDRARRVDAAFAELNLPLAKTIEANAALRFDRYEGVGNSTTPKFSLRWQPRPEVVLRAAVGRGFRAPSLQDLYLPQTTNVTPQGASDPLRCPVTHSLADCGTQFNLINGGNPALKPERSTNETLGLVFSPTANSLLALDAFRIRLKDIISNGVPAALILADLEKYGHLVQRGPVDPAFPALPGPITAILGTNLNLGELRVAGLDLDARGAWTLGRLGKLAARLSGTYFSQYDVQNLDGSFTGAVDQVNAVTGGIVPRWRHYLSLDWSLGPWGATLAQNYQKGYHDLVATNAAPGDPLRRVGAYETWDLQLRYTGLKDLELKFGIRNLFDQDPPYTNAGGQTSFQGGYDPTYADPRGRFVYAGLNWRFR